MLIVHAAAWDSVPADVGVLLAARQARRLGLVAVEAEVAHRFAGVEAAHATTFEAAVHGFAAASSGKLGAVRKAVGARFPQPPALARHRGAIAASLAADRAKQGSGGLPPRPKRSSLGWDSRHSAYAVKFPGSDASVVRHSQRRLGDSDAAAELCPRVSVVVLIASLKGLLITAVVGAVFGFLARFGWGRGLLLRYPRFFSLGVFTHEGPSPSQLAAGTFTSTVTARCMPEQAFRAGGDGGASVPGRDVVVTVSGPEPGYVATPLLFLAVAATLLDLDPNAPGPESKATCALPVASGCVTPAALVGAGPALDALVRRMAAGGIAVAGI